MLVVKLLLILFFNIIYVDGRRFNAESKHNYLSEKKKYFCTHVAVAGDDSNLKAQFIINVESISMNDPSVPIPDIPIFIFPKAQLKKFYTNFNLRLDPGGVFYMRDDLGTLKVEIKDEFAKDEINYYLGSLATSQLNKASEDREVLLKFNVKESTMYCAVIYLPEAVVKLRTKEYALSSHGYLPYQIYVTLHSQLIYCIILTLIIGLMGFTFYRFGKKHLDSTDGGFDSSSVALIFRSFFYFVYLPTYISAVVRYSFNLHANYAQNSLHEEKISIKLLDLVDKFFNITNSYVLFLLAAGYGSFYSGLGFGYEKPSSFPTSFHTPMPARMWNRGIQFYVLNVISTFLLALIEKYGNKMYQVFDYFEGIVDGGKHINAYYFMNPIIDFLDVTFPLIWMTTSVFYYFRHLKTIRKVSQSGSNKNQYMAKIKRSYRSSIVPIFIIPLAFGLIHLGIAIEQANSAGREFNRTEKLSSYEDDDSLESIANIPTYTLLKLWIIYLATLLSMIYTYFFWMKDNVGVKLLSRTGSTQNN